MSIKAMQEAFADFATRCLNAAVFSPDQSNDEDTLFAASLASTNAYVSRRRGTSANGTAFAVSAGFLDRMTPNALADRWRGTHYIAVNQALLATMAEFMLFAFTQRDVFPEIGDAGGEDSPDPVNGQVPGLFLLDRTLAEQGINADSDRHRVPKDAQRHFTALYTALLMARFVWLHELAHCYEGHVALVQDTGRALRLYEVPEALGLATPAKNLRAASGTLIGLEFEADEAAFLDCCRIQLADEENIDRIAALDLLTRLRMTLFACYAATWLFEEYGSYLSLVQGLTHPAPFDRLRHIFAVAARDLGPHVGDFDRLHQSVVKDFAALRRAIPALHCMDGLRPGAIQSDASLEKLRTALAAYRFRRPSP